MQFYTFNVFPNERKYIKSINNNCDSWLNNPGQV